MTYNSAKNVYKKSTEQQAKKAKHYSSASEMLHAIAEDQEDKDFAKSVEEELGERTLLHFLFGARASRGVSQKDIAKRIGCSQSRVSKIENGLDASLSLGDLDAYLNALGMKSRLFITTGELTVIDEVKFHAFRIKHCLDRLVEIAGDDPLIRRSVDDAHKEIMYNLVRMVASSAMQLPGLPSDLPSIIEAGVQPDDCGTHQNIPTAGAT